MLRTAQSLPLTGLSTLGSDAGRFPPTPPACYRASRQLPGPDSHRQATTSLSNTKIHHGHYVTVSPPVLLGARKLEVRAVPEIRNIVFDSNVFGRQALPKVKTIRLWAKACAEKGAELWIPKVVAFELAQHVVEAHATFAEQHSAHRQRLEAWGQPVGEQLRSIGVEDVLSAIRTAAARIVPLAGYDAREAILDQVLLRGAGSRESGVKAGAADSAWVLSIIAYNDGEPDGLIVVTCDTRALERTCLEMGVDVPRNGKHLGDVSHLLDESSPASEELAAKFRDWLQEYCVGGLADPRGEGIYLTEVADLGPHNWWQVEALPDDGYEA